MPPPQIVFCARTGTLRDGGRAPRWIRRRSRACASRGSPRRSPWPDGPSESALGIVRALREQIRWDEIRERTRGMPFADALLVLAEGRGILGPEHSRG